MKTDKNETWLIKNLRRCSIEDIITKSLPHSLIYVSNSSNEIIQQGVILPWHLDSLLLMKVIAGDGDNYKLNISDKLFRKMINKVVDFENKFEDENIKDTMTRLIINQKPYQANLSTLQYRANFLFNYEGDYVNMKKEFEEIIGANPNDVEQLFLIFRTIFIAENTDSLFKEKLIQIILKNKNNLSILNKYTIDSNDIIKKFAEDNIEFFQLSLFNYYLNSYIAIRDTTTEKLFLTYPHNIISAYNYGTYFRLMHESDDNQLRSKFGKYVLEDYLHKIIYESIFFKKVMKEFKFAKENFHTSDVIAIEDDNLFFFEMKASVVPKNLRNINEKENFESLVTAESNKIKQVYNQIERYKKHKYLVNENNKPYNKIFGVIVNFEDRSIDRRRIFERFFEKNFPNISDSKKLEIQNTIRIIDLSNLEFLILYENNKTFKELLFDNDYTLLNFEPDLIKPIKRLPSFEYYIQNSQDKATILLKHYLEDMMK